MKKLNRRSALKRSAAWAALLGGRPVGRTLGAPPSGGEEGSKKSGLGLVIYDCLLRRRQLRSAGKPDLFEPRRFLEHCRAVGAGGMQVNLTGLSDREAAALGERAEQHGMFIDAIVRPPEDREDSARFEAEIRLAASARVRAARTVVMPGRRYERFRSLDEFRRFTVRARKMLERAAPIVEKHRVPLAVENHKGQRIDERVSLLKHFDSEFVGACVDTGNNLALLDDPIRTVEALAPWAKTVHLKDQALKLCEDGFLLADIPLGQGSLDLKRMVRILRKAQPDIRFVLELITRDALKVPCLTDEYWITMPRVSGRELARTLRFVRVHQSHGLPQVSRLSPEKQVALEDANLTASFQYARRELDM